MIEGDFGDAEGSEAVGFSHGQFGLVVEALDDSAGELFSGAEIIEDQFPVAAQGPGDLLHRLDTRAHDLLAPIVEKPGGPSRRVVLPELLEISFEQIGAHRLEIVAQQIAQPEALWAGEIGLALEDAPPGLFQHWLVTVLGEAAGLGSTCVVEGFVHVGDDVEAIEDVDGFGAAFADDAQVWLPHVRGDEFDAVGYRLADPVEELLETLPGAVIADPQQPG